MTAARTSGWRSIAAMIDAAAAGSGRGQRSSTAARNAGHHQHRAEQTCLLRKFDRVAIWAFNRAEWVIAVLGEESLLRTGAYVLGWDLGLQSALGKVAGAEPRQHNQSPLMNSYRASDRRWFFFAGLQAERHIGAVCRALVRPELLDDERFSSAVAMRKRRTEVVALLGEIIAQRPLSEWSERFDREGVW